MRRGSLAACVMTFFGCTGPSEPHVAVQPLVVAEPVPSTGEDATSEIDPLVENPVGGAARVGLVSPDDGVDSRWLSVEPSDFSTATRGVQPTLIFGPDAPEAEECLRTGACLRLVTYPEEATVEVEVVRVQPPHGDTSRRLTLVPRMELSDRWYAVEIILNRDVHQASRVGVRQLARFRPDSAPILNHALVNGRGELELRFSERVSGDVAAGGWRVEDAAGVMRCEVLGPGVDRPESRAVFVCERGFDGPVVVSPGSGLRTVLGTEVRDEARTPLERFVIPEDATAAANRWDAVVRVSLYTL